MKQKNGRTFPIIIIICFVLTLFSVLMYLYKFEKKDAKNLETPIEQKVKSNPKFDESSSSTIVTSTTFDACGPIQEYAIYGWFKDLIQNYHKAGFSEDFQTGGDACLSKDQSLFVFITPDSRPGHGCGQIFEYILDQYGSPTGPKNILKTPQGEYCSQKFGKRIDNYFLFTGHSENGPGECENYTGKYFFDENRVEVKKSDC